MRRRHISSLALVVVILLLAASPALSQRSGRVRPSKSAAAPQESPALQRPKDPCAREFGNFRLVQGARSNQPLRSSPLFYLRLRHVRAVAVSDTHGNTDSDPFTLPWKFNVKGIHYDSIRDDSLLIMLPVEETYFVKFQGSGPVVETLLNAVRIDMVRGCGTTWPDQAVRFNDVVVPERGAALLKITPQGVAELSVDEEGDGGFEKNVAPTAVAEGHKAADQSGPRISVREERRETTITVTIEAEDEAGVKVIHYGLGAPLEDGEGFTPKREQDGKIFHRYTRPLQLELTRPQVIFVIADDELGNRSMTDYQLKHAPEK